MYDNTCLFIDWVVRGTVPAASTTQSGSIKKTFKACAPRPSKDGTWNGHLFVAWGETAKKLDELNVANGTHLVLTTTEQAYTDSNGQRRSTYLVNDFQIIGALPKKEQTQQQPQQPVQGQTKEGIPVKGDIDGYDALMSEFM